MLLQSQARGLAARRRYQKLRHLAIGLQARARGLWARQRYQQMRQERAVSGEMWKVGEEVLSVRRLDGRLLVFQCFRKRHCLN